MAAWLTATRKTLTSACAALRRVGQSSPLLKGKDEDFAAARHFDGSVSKREVLAGREYTMDLWHARPGDIVVAKIDLKNGAVGIVPDDWKNVVVTGHFAVYEPDRTKIVPEFPRRVIQTSFFKAHLWRNKVGAEGRKEVKLDFFESQVIPLPSLAEQEAIVARWRSAQAHVAIAEKLIEKPKERLNRYLYSATNTEPFETAIAHA